MEILVTGGRGQVGIELARLAWPADVALHLPDRAELDLASPASIAAATAPGRYGAIVSAGAYTAVDRAESEVAEAWAVNAVAPALLARGAALAGIPIVHVSTDYVFDGTKETPYTEDDPVAPLNVYGASKEGGEQAVRTANPRHAILRTAWVVSAQRTNFLKTMLRLARERDEVSVVADQRGCPTFAANLASTLQRVTLALLREDAPAGTWHYVDAGEASWSEFAAAIFAASARRGGPSARVRAIPTAEYPTPARRPRNSRLATARIARDFGIAPPSWQVGLDAALAELI